MWPAIRSRRLRRYTSLCSVLVSALTLTSCTWNPFASSPSTAPTYYVSPFGNNAATGTSPTSPWRTLGKASSVPLPAGSRLLLEGGHDFVGPLYLGKWDTGTSSAPVVVSSYGSGAATIFVQSGDGISVYDTAGVDIDDVDIVGAPGPDIGDGIDVYSDLPAGHRLDHIDISHVDASNFLNGISIGGKNANAGFTDVQVSHTSVDGNVDSGIIVYGPQFNAKAPTYANQNVVVSDVAAWDNFGNPKDKTQNTGNGIVLGSVRDGKISSSVATKNGGAGAGVQGPEGIWTYNSTEVDIEHDLSYANKTKNGSDGNGFGLDQNVSHSILQDNLSYGNDGTGFLVYSSLNNGAQRYNTVRDNISSDDVRDGSQFYGGISIVGHVTNCATYQNTVVMGPAGMATPPALRISPDLKHDTFMDNIFSTVSGPIVATTEALPQSSVEFEGDDFYSASGLWTVTWGANSYGSLPDWRAAIGQPANFALNPQLAGPVFGLSATSPSDLTDTAKGFQLKPGSPLVGAGHALTSLGAMPTPTNYLGRPQSPQHPDIGAM